MACSIVDIAREAGVSHTTVSRILRNAEGCSYSESTREKVRSVAREMGYTPNLAAKFMRTKKTKIIGIATQSEKSYDAFRMNQNCSINIRRCGYSPVLVDMNNQDSEGNFVNSLNFLAGLICPKEAHEKKAVELCRQKGLDIPIVTLSPKATSSKNVRMTINNSKEIMADVIEHLQELGHERIAYVGYESFTERSDSFIKACKERKTKGELFQAKPEDGHNNSYLNGSATAARIAKSGKISAALCEDDEFALGLISGLQDLGLSVPEDFSVVGFDDLPFAAVSRPKLTTVRTRSMKRATAAAKLLVSLIEANQIQKEMLPESIFFECKLIVRESTGKAPKQSE